MESLEFLNLTKDGNIISGWSVVPSGKWKKDCKTGTEYALDLAEYMSISGNSALMIRVMRDIAKDHSGIAIGFLMMIGQLTADFFSVDT